MGFIKNLFKEVHNSPAMLIAMIVLATPKNIQYFIAGKTIALVPLILGVIVFYLAVKDYKRKY